MIFGFGKGNVWKLENVSPLIFLSLFTCSSVSFMNKSTMVGIVCKYAAKNNPLPQQNLHLEVLERKSLLHYQGHLHIP
jgi:hypothetical protein